jgi:uncharacterized repeat protein (TIGR01451 family)
MSKALTARRVGSRSRVVSRVMFALLVAVVAIGGAAAPGGAVPPAVTVDKTGLPGSVTRGYHVLYTITVTNGSTAANHVSVTDPAPGNPLPAGTTVVSATTNVGTCPALAAGATSVTCDIGSMSAGQVATLKIKVKTTTDTSVSSFTNVAVATLNESGHDNEGPAQHPDKFFGDESTTLIAAGDPLFAQGYFDSACNASNPSDPSLIGTNPNVGAGNLQATQACVADTGGGTTVSVGESPDTEASPGVSETSTICVPAPGATCATPLTFTTPATFTFTLHPSQFPNKWSYREIVVYDDGVEVTAFCNGDGSLPTGATVCKFPATQDKKTKIVTQVVKSLSNGEWNFD